MEKEIEKRLREIEKRYKDLKRIVSGFVIIFIVALTS